MFHRRGFERFETIESIIASDRREHGVHGGDLVGAAIGKAARQASFHQRDGRFGLFHDLVPLGCAVISGRSGADNLEGDGRDRRSKRCEAISTIARQAPA